MRFPLNSQRVLYYYQINTERLLTAVAFQMVLTVTLHKSAVWSIQTCTMISNLIVPPFLDNLS
jgi:hypothetical protein